MPCLSFTAAF